MADKRFKSFTAKDRRRYIKRPDGTLITVKKMENTNGSTIKKVHYGIGCVNYEWRQKHSCGCSRDLQIRAMEKGAYKLA